jgi:hypothetical protein
MTAAEHEANDLSLPGPTHEPQAEESLTDVIDQMARNAFRRALERRHVTPTYRILVESAHLVRTSSS